MERKINCNIMTPDGVIYNGKVNLAIVTAYDGERGFLYNHAPMIAELGFGEVRLRTAESINYLVVEGGFVEIKDNEMTVFAERAIKKENLVKSNIEHDIKNLQSQAKSKLLTERVKVELDIRKLKARLKVASR